ncbi:MAG: hypothetical protein ACXVI5_07885 [Halobacteriota archaeon]
MPNVLSEQAWSNWWLSLPEIFEQLGVAPGETITVSRMDDTIYTGTYAEPNGNKATFAHEIVQSESVARDRYRQIVGDKRSEGYAPAPTITLEPVPSASWSGVKENVSAARSYYHVWYGYNKDIEKWIVSMIQY